MGTAAKSTKAGGKLKEEWKRRRKRLLLQIGAGIVTVLALLVLAIYPLFLPRSETRRPVSVSIPTGAGVSGIAAILEQKEIVRSGWAFRTYARLKGAGSKFHAGRYRLSPDMSLARIVQALNAGAGGGLDGEQRVTIPEGFTLKQIAALLQTKGVCDAQEFQAAATNPDVLAQIPTEFPLPKDTAEGYLFPDTYYFDRKTPPKQVIADLLLNFSVRFFRPYQRDIEGSGRDLHRIVTTASLIEREAEKEDERARIAGVIDNRIAKNMRLEIDATVLYALGYHKEQVLYKDLKVDSPYNTYRNKGLPPGPIACPGLLSLMAALHPEQNDYLFYVARPGGHHIFTKTNAEHDAARAQARRERRQRQRDRENTTVEQ